MSAVDDVKQRIDIVDLISQHVTLKRAGRVWHIVHIMSLNPRVLKASIGHYAAIMFGPSPLSRVQRELLATVVSAEVGCHY